MPEDDGKIWSAQMTRALELHMIRCPKEKPFLLQERKLRKNRRKKVIDRAMLSEALANVRGTSATPDEAAAKSAKDDDDDEPGTGGFGGIEQPRDTESEEYDSAAEDVTPPEK